MGMLAFIQTTEAGTFTSKQGDLCVGFRKVSPFTELSEDVVNIGQVTNYLNVAAGTSINVTSFSLSQITPDTLSSLDNVGLSAFGAVNNNAYPGYPLHTIWVTMPRSDPNVQSTPPDRIDQDSLASVVSPINSIISGAAAISLRIAVGADNTTNFVKEPSSSSSTIGQGQNLSAYVSSQVDPTQANFQDNWSYNIETATASPFATAIRSDLYEVVPTGFADLHNGLTTGSAYYVGYFQFNTDGSLAFTRASGTTPPPPSPALTITRTGNANAISFTSTANATYKLYYTNSAGLSVATTNWPSLPGTITGDGTTKSFLDTTSDSMRFYRATAH
jgi:hypothetical protein